MKTGDLISALAGDAKPGISLARALAFAIVAAVVLAGIVFVVHLGPRTDFMQAAGTVRFLFKFVLTLALTISALVAVLRLARPGAGGSSAVLLVAPVLLAIAIVLELMSVPAEDWAARWIGHNAVHCMISIPLLSLGPLAVLLAAMRLGAATRPVLAGAVAGLLAAGIGASFYAAHCFDDSPLFVATWYSIAIAFMAALGALAGSRLLRW